MILFIWFQAIIQQIILPHDNMIHGYENLFLILSALQLYISKTAEEVIKLVVISFLRFFFLLC